MMIGKPPGRIIRRRLPWGSLVVMVVVVVVVVVKRTIAGGPWNDCGCSNRRRRRRRNVENTVDGGDDPTTIISFVFFFSDGVVVCCCCVGDMRVMRSLSSSVCVCTVVRMSIWYFQQFIHFWIGSEVRAHGTRYSGFFGG